jgi:DNA-binding CsgD family transcriptional regulator
VQVAQINSAKTANDPKGAGRQRTGAPAGRTWAPLWAIDLHPRQRHVARHAPAHGPRAALPRHGRPGEAPPRSLPLVACLLDGVKYCEPDDEPLPEDAAEARQRAPRGPTLRAMVRHVVRAVDAEADDARLRRRQRAQALVAYGLRQIEIAEALGVSKQTVTADLAAARDRAPLAPGAVAVTVR